MQAASHTLAFTDDYQDAIVAMLNAPHPDDQLLQRCFRTSFFPEGFCGVGWCISPFHPEVCSPSSRFLSRLQWHFPGVVGTESLLRCRLRPARWKLRFQNALLRGGLTDPHTATAFVGGAFIGPSFMGRAFSTLIKSLTALRCATANAAEQPTGGAGGTGSKHDPYSLPR